MSDSAKGGVFLFVGNTLSLVILAVGSMLVARFLGPENYGLLSLSLVVPTILAGLIDLGVSSSLTRFLAKSKAENKDDVAASILKTGVWFNLALSLPALLFCFVCSDVIATSILQRPEISFFIKVASAQIVFQTVFTTSSAVFIGLDKTEGSALIMNAQAIAKAVLSPTLVVVGLSIMGALVGHITSYMIASIVGSLLLYHYYKRLGTPSSSRFSDNLKRMLDYSVPLYLTTLLSLLISQYQNIISALFVSNFEIGNLSIAVTLTILMNVITFPLTILFPAFCKVDPHSQQLGKLFRVAVKYTALLVIPATVAIALTSTNVVEILYGSAYTLAPSYLSLSILSFLYTGAGSIVLAHLFNGIGQTRVVFKYTLLNFLLFLFLAPLFTMVYQVPGLIVASLLSTLFSLIYGLRIARKQLNVMFDWRTSVKIYLASCVSAIPTVLFLSHSPLSGLFNLLVAWILFLGTYLTLTPLIGIVDHSDIHNVTFASSKLTIIAPLIQLLLRYETKLIMLHDRLHVRKTIQ